MLSRRSPIARIPLLRPLRPPNIQSERPWPRLFTQNSQLLLIAQHVPRPQLPYLTQPVFKRPHPLNAPIQQSTRLLSTETKRIVREQIWLATKWTVIIWAFIGLGSIAWFGIRVEMDERTHPTPDEWRWRTRQALRLARAVMSQEQADMVGFVNWNQVEISLQAALKNLEDPEHEGKGLTNPSGDGEEILIADMGKAGFDISSKSWPWRSGYFEVIMGCATAAEHLDSMVLDQTRNMVFPKAVVIGPSNPDPRPVPPYMAAAPLEENCIEPCPPPETFYLRILTGRGFTTKQKMDAALGYASWLQFKGLPESAEEMYKWGIDIAKSALPPGTDSEDVIDNRANVVKPSKDEMSTATPNLLRAATDLAMHYARTGNVSAALPIFLSVLRARRSAPVSPFPELQEASSSPSGYSLRSIMNKFLHATPFPPPPPSGDDPLIRSSAESTCEESELMLYIGEILFATSPSSAEGLGWTRQAVDIADSSLEKASKLSRAEAGKTAQKCRECLVTGAGNWELMLRRLLEEREASGAAGKGWFSFGKKSQRGPLSAERLDDELAEVLALKSRIVDQGIELQVARGRTSNPSGVWLG